MPRTPLALPGYPWDALGPHAARARAHPEGIVDLSIGSPVDETPALVRGALAAATDAHAYPLTAGSPALREAIVAWFADRRGVTGLGVQNVIPTIGSKELVAMLPLMLGVRAGDTVVHPLLAYPTYAIGAAIAGADAFASDDPAEWPDSTALVWVNSPANPDGTVRDAGWLRAALARARELGAVIAGDECYAELVWSGDGSPACSILDPRVVGDDRSGVLAVYSLSKQSNLAGYRAGIVAGCSELVGELLEVRKHAGLIPPAPVQRAMIAALGDHGHVAAQRERYAARRRVLRAALEGAGFRIDASEGGLYLWASRDEDCWRTVAALAELGILVGPGSFYGASGSRHVRVALTAADAQVAAAAERLAR
ncbi:MAG: succinyldiaminopimelate transaminase [Microbacteriaceae bacterium]